MKTLRELALQYVNQEQLEYEEAAGAYYGFIAGYAAAQPKWISVKERLPEILDGHFISKEVLWINCYGEIEVSFLEKLRSGLRIDWGEAGLYKLDQVTHWMPLPELPKEEK